MKTIYKMQINNDHEINKGFELIALQSGEKNKIAYYLESFFSRRLRLEKFPAILDIGAGNSVIWNYLFGSGKVRDFHPESYSLDIVDSSESRTKKASLIFSGDSNVSVMNRDVLEYMNHCQQKYDLISAIHFIPGLAADCMEYFVTDCMEILKDHGHIFIVQPAPGNNLSTCKDQLFLEFYNEKRTRAFLDTSAIEQKYNVKKEISTCSFYVEENDLISLARFLLGNKYKEHMPMNPGNRIFDNIFSPFRTDGRFKFTIMNEFILIEKSVNEV
jgi:hypothetical protein